MSRQLILHVALAARQLHLLPPGVAEKLKLTANQKKQLADLEAEVQARPQNKILTPEQQEQFKQVRFHPGQVMAVRTPVGLGPRRLRGAMMTEKDRIKYR